MNAPASSPTPTPAYDFAALVDARGYVVVYRLGDSNHCPGCARSAWHVGRVTAECAHCGTALPLFAPLAAEATPILEGKD